MFAGVTVAGGVGSREGTREKRGDCGWGQGSEISAGVWGYVRDPKWTGPTHAAVALSPGRGRSADFHAEVLSLPLALQGVMGWPCEGRGKVEGLQGSPKDLL